MLFVSLFKPKPGSHVGNRLAKRVDWKFPEGVRLVEEYWLPAGELEVITITEADDALTIVDSLIPWNDDFEISTYPAVTVEQGIAHARELMAVA